MARNKNHFCTNCRTENMGKAVLQNEGRVTKDWRWECSGCNTISEITEIVPEHIPKPRKTFKHEKRFFIDEHLNVPLSKN